MLSLKSEWQKSRGTGDKGVAVPVATVECHADGISRAPLKQLWLKLRGQHQMQQRNGRNEGSHKCDSNGEVISLPGAAALPTSCSG